MSKDKYTEWALKKIVTSKDREEAIVFFLQLPKNGLFGEVGPME